ncbi:MAG: 50S ribosomal protein L29 [Candidatus Pacebacteria bacterium]|nr:50S ribosomal protein L29 [Candidatus Paceibacterota bacterium]
MKRKKFLEEILNKSEADLLKSVSDKKESLRSLKFDLVAGKIKNVKEIKNIKKEIARILTILKKKEK